MDESTKKTETIKAWQAVGFVWEVLVFVAVPTTLFALAGRWADRHWHLSPWMTVLGLILALGVTAILMKRKVKDYKQLL